MAAAATMPTTRPPPPPPPPKRKAASHSSTPLASNEDVLKPPSSKKSRPAPPRPPKAAVRSPEVCIPAMSIPLVLRDVEAYAKVQKVGQGTYGSVFMGSDKETGEIVALKRINTEQEENGFPITAIREIKILKALNHENIVGLKEIVVSKEETNDQIPKSVYMVFEYLEYDLTGILETSEIRLTEDHIKSWAYQLLNGVNYMHKQKIIHRDLKASNLLISKNGTLKIADWGLARSWNEQMVRLTNRVITLWYRPPELLLGCIQYTPKIDMWSVGCIIAEMFRRSGFLRGATEAHQLELIFQTAGTPDVQSWPNIHKLCPIWKNHESNALQNPRPNRIDEALRRNALNSNWITKEATSLVESLLVLNPENRMSAYDALDHGYFWETKSPKKDAKDLNMNFGVKSVHEWEARKKQQDAIEMRKKGISIAPPRPVTVGHSAGHSAGHSFQSSSVSSATKAIKPVVQPGSGSGGGGPRSKPPPPPRSNKSLKPPPPN